MPLDRCATVVCSSSQVPLTFCLLPVAGPLHHCHILLPNRHGKCWVTDISVSIFCSNSSCCFTPRHHKLSPGAGAQQPSRLSQCTVQLLSEFNLTYCLAVSGVESLPTDCDISLATSMLVLLHSHEGLWGVIRNCHHSQRTHQGSHWLRTTDVKAVLTQVSETAWKWLLWCCVNLAVLDGAYFGVRAGCCVAIPGCPVLHVGAYFRVA